MNGLRTAPYVPSKTFTSTPWPAAPSRVVGLDRAVKDGQLPKDRSGYQSGSFPLLSRGLLNSVKTRRQLQRRFFLTACCTARILARRHRRSTDVGGVIMLGTLFGL